MNPPISLSDHQLAATARTHGRRAGAFPTDALAKVPARLRPGVQALAFHALRHWGEAGALITLLAERPPEGAARALLGLALTLLLPAAAAGNVSYAAHTVVDQAVQALVQPRLPPGTGRFHQCLPAPLPARAGRAAGPIRRMRRRAGTTRSGGCSACGATIRSTGRPCWRQQPARTDGAARQPAPRRARRLSGAAAREQGLAAELVGPTASNWRRRSQSSVARLGAGHCSVQDLAAQLAAPLLLDGAGLAPDARVLTPDAAPGGKTAHLLECAELELTALDVDPQRCERIRDNLQRLGLRAEVRGQMPPRPRAGGTAAPSTPSCSMRPAPRRVSCAVTRCALAASSGDIAQRSRRSSCACSRRLAHAARRRAACSYCTCSVFKAEGEQQMQDFLSRPRSPAPARSRPSDAGRAGLAERLWRSSIMRAEWMGSSMPCCSSDRSADEGRQTVAARALRWQARCRRSGAAAVLVRRSPSATARS